MRVTCLQMGYALWTSTIMDLLIDAGLLLFQTSKQFMSECLRRLGNLHVTVILHRISKLLLGVWKTVDSGLLESYLAIPIPECLGRSALETLMLLYRKLLVFWISMAAVHNAALMDMDVMES